MIFLSTLFVDFLHFLDCYTHRLSSRTVLLRLQSDTFWFLRSHRQYLTYSVSHHSLLYSLHVLDVIPPGILGIVNNYETENETYAKCNHPKLVSSVYCTEFNIFPLRPMTKFFPGPLLFPPLFSRQTSITLSNPSYTTRSHHRHLHPSI